MSVQKVGSGVASADTDARRLPQRGKYELYAARHPVEAGRLAVPASANRSSHFEPTKRVFKVCALKMDRRCAGNVVLDALVLSAQRRKRT
jgi:hypothetical protein